MEPLEIEDIELTAPEKPWAIKGTKETRDNLICSIYLVPDEMEQQILKLQAKYKKCEEAEVRYETYMTDDAEILLVGYGVVSRVLRSAVDEARAQGMKVGLFRPISLWPYPTHALAEVASKVRSVLVVEMSTGQMVEDVRLAINGKVPVEFFGRCGGVVPSVAEVHAELLNRVVAAV